MNNAYFSTYKEYHHEFQTDSREILIAYGYKDALLYLTYLDNSKGTWMVKKVSWTLSLGYNLLSIILFTRKKVEVFLREPHILLKISHKGIFFEVANIVDN